MSLIELELIEELFSQSEKLEILRRLRNVPLRDSENVTTAECKPATAKP